MDIKIIEGKLGEVGSYKAEVLNGNLKFSANVKTDMVKVDFSAEGETDAVLDYAAKAIPGPIDDAIFGVIKAALKNK